MPLLFVYGTFLRGRANTNVLTGLGATFVASAQTVEPHILFDLGPYPALVDGRADDAPEPSAPVFGEIWEVPDDSLAPLDAFEGCPELFKRVSVPVEADGSARVDAFAYVFTGQLPRGARVIASGRYESIGRVLPHGAKPADIRDDEAS